uniref:PsbP C-terminal domain-containing protein n=1 Tax=Picea sitchensis TaxID=3332 RepID=D5AAL9_PICSI|nr:unknown [Picea sitchensis]
MTSIISRLLPCHLHPNPSPQPSYLPSSKSSCSSLLLLLSAIKQPSRRKDSNGSLRFRWLCSWQQQPLGEREDDLSNGSLQPNPYTSLLIGVGQCGTNYSKRGGVVSTRREGLISLALLAASMASAHDNAGAQDEKSMPSLERFIDEKEGFTLLKPSDWNKVDKAGATVLFEDPDVRTNNIGVVVNPVRISSLKDFGTPQDVADKLLKAERKKPSTNDVQLIRIAEKAIHGDIPLYELEYSLDSSRGIKRVLSAVTVASKKLYLLNISYSDSPDKPLLPNARMRLEQVLDSFDVLH